MRVAVLLALLMSIPRVPVPRLVPPAAEPRAAAPSQGEQLFHASGCTGCHTIGAGVLVGPDLRGVAQRRARALIAQFIEDPDLVYRLHGGTPLNAGYEHMPPLGVSNRDANVLADYLVAPR